VKFKKGDFVIIKSKSTGRALKTIKKESYDITKPQQIESIDNGRIINIKGDYFLEYDLKLAYGTGDLNTLFDNLIEEL
jgi:hypothetical protein